MKVVMGLNNGLHNVPVRIEPGQSSLAPPPFNNNNTVTNSATLVGNIALCGLLALVCFCATNRQKKDKCTGASKKKINGWEILLWQKQLLEIFAYFAHFVFMEQCAPMAL